MYLNILSFMITPPHVIWLQNWPNMCFPRTELLHVYLLYEFFISSNISLKTSKGSIVLNCTELRIHLKMSQS